MALWIPITIAAAFLQNVRSAVQAHLKTRIGMDGAVFVRFGFGAPFALLYAAALHTLHAPSPDPTLAWAGFVALGAATQILGTYALLGSFDDASFAVGTAYSKTEPIQAALFGAVILGEFLSLGALLAVLLGLSGVLMLSLRRGLPLSALIRSRGAAWGLAAAALFGVSAVSYRAAALALESGDFLSRSGLTLAAATLGQAVALGVFLSWARPGELGAVARAWRPGLAAGAAGAAASGCWFAAMTLEPAAHVRALAQVELIFTFAASILIFAERPSLRDVLGVCLIVAGVALLLLAV